MNKRIRVGFKVSVESDTTRPSCMHLENCCNKFDTICNIMHELSTELMRLGVTWYDSVEILS